MAAPSRSLAPTASKSDTPCDLTKRAGYETPRMTKSIAEHAHTHGLEMGLSGVFPTIIAMDCGYPASSLKERVYALRESETSDRFGRCGILIYTASAGTLGGHWVGSLDWRPGLQLSYEQPWSDCAFAQTIRFAPTTIRMNATTTEHCTGRRATAVFS